MIRAVFYENPALVGVFVALSTSLLGYLGYRRSLRMDRAVEKSGVVTSHADSFARVVTGLDSLVENLQDDNEKLRVEVRLLRDNVAVIQTRLAVVELGSTDLREKNLALEHENAVLHAENEAFKVQIQELKARIAVLEKLNGPTKEEP